MPKLFPMLNLLSSLPNFQQHFRNSHFVYAPETCMPDLPETCTACLTRMSYHLQLDAIAMHALGKSDPHNPTCKKCQLLGVYVGAGFWVSVYSTQEPI